ncbi:MAG: VOC family protein [Spirochaetes bacterium]|nr:VOC family protein [Spirochaetota bacterium]
MTFAHIGLSVKDMEIAINWYKDFFGFKEIKRFEKKELEIKGALISNGNMNIELLMPEKLVKNLIEYSGLKETLRFQGLNHFAVNVDDIKVLYDKMMSEKVTLLTELIDDRLFFCLDPDGTKIEIKQS